MKYIYTYWYIQNKDIKLKRDRKESLIGNLIMISILIVSS